MRKTESVVHLETPFLIGLRKRPLDCPTTDAYQKNFLTSNVKTAGNLGAWYRFLAPILNFPHHCEFRTFAGQSNLHNDAEIASDASGLAMTKCGLTELPNRDSTFRSPKNTAHDGGIFHNPLS
jgi:hypothetical protein